MASFKKWTSILRKVGLGLVGFLSVVSLMIVLAVVGMKVSAKKTEIKILNLIGAHRAYIKIPFVFEGIFYGLTGAFFAWSFAYLTVLYSTPLLLEFFEGVDLLPVSSVFMLLLLGGELLAGMFIGGLGGLLAVKRHLK